MCTDNNKARSKAQPDFNNHNNTIYRPRSWEKIYCTTENSYTCEQIRMAR